MVLSGRTGAMIFIAPVRFFVLPQREQQRLHAPAGIRFARSRSSGDCTSQPESASPAVRTAGIARAFPYEGKAAKAIFCENCFRWMRWNIGYPPTSPTASHTAPRIYQRSPQRRILSANQPPPPHSHSVFPVESRLTPPVIQKKSSDKTRLSFHLFYGIL